MRSHLEIHGITPLPHQHHVPTINIQLLLIPISCRFYNQSSHTCHIANIMLYLSITDHKPS